MNKDLHGGNIYKFQNIDLDNNVERIIDIVKKYIKDEN